MSSVNASSPYPPGYLNHYNSKGHVAFGLAIAFVVIEVSCVVLRFLARKIGNVPWGADDVLIIPGLIFCVGVCASSLVDLTKGGIAHHQAALELSDPEEIVVWAKLAVSIPVIYLGAILFPKSAILAIFLRIFTKAPYRKTCYALAVLLIANWVANTTAGLLMCVPLRYLWDKSILGGHCFDINTYFRWSSLINILTDVVMLLLPLPVVWKLRTSTNIKIGLSFTFAMGSVGLITSIIRFAGFFEENAEVDVTYSATSLIIWTICESGTYLIAACLPTYRPLALLLWKKSPLSSLRPGPKATKQKQQSRSDGSTLRMETYQNVGFERLNDERNTLGGPFGSNASSRVESGKPSNGEITNERQIMVRQDIDVSSA